MLVLLLFAVAPFVHEPLPDGALARLGSLRDKHGTSVYGLAISPDGKTVAAAGVPQGITQWDRATGACLRRCNADFHSSSLTFVPGGRSFLVLTNEGARQLSLDGETEGPPFTGLRGATSNLAVSADGRLLAAGDLGGRLIVWERGRRPLHTLWFTGRRASVIHPGEAVAHVAFHPTRADVAAIDLAGDLVVCDLSSGTIRWRAFAHTSRDESRPVLAYHPRGDCLVTAGPEGTLRAWSPDGHPGRVLTLGERAVISLAFSPDGTLATSYADCTVRLFDVKAGREVRRWRTGASPARQLVWTPDGREILSASVHQSGFARWDAASGRRLNPPVGHTGPAVALHHVRGRLLSLDRERTLVEWRDGVGHRRPLLVDAAGFTSVSLSADGKTAAFAGPHPSHVYVIDAATGKRCQRFDGPTAGVVTLALSGDGRRLAVSGEYGNGRVWDTTTGQTLIARREMSGPFAWSPDGTRLLGRGPRFELTLYDVANNKPLASVSGAAGPAAFLPDGRTVVLAYQPPEGGSRIGLWDTQAGVIVRTWDAGRNLRELLAVSANGRLAATVGQEVTVWELATGQKTRAWPKSVGQVTGLAFAADGSTLASGSGDSTILLWDVTGGAKAGDPLKDWEALLDPKGFNAVCRLARTPGAEAVLARKLAPALPVEPGRWAALLDRLDSDEFAARGEAMRDIRRHGPGAAGQARAAIRTDPRLEVRRRLRALVQEWEDSPEQLRLGRAVMALEWAKAAALLNRLAAGADGVELTEDARAALARMKR